jgi:glucosamine 6-phosphate synthetase-like amidotransferase/phosphosugar isomerase protein
MSKKTEAEEKEEIKEKAQKTIFDAEKKEVKTLAEILEKTKEPREIFIPALGCAVKIGFVPMKKFAKLMAIEDKVQMSNQMVFEMMQAADPSVTMEQVMELPFQFVTAIVEEMMEGGMGFQRDTKRRRPQ